MDRAGEELAHAAIEVDEKYAEDTAVPSSSSDPKSNSEEISEKQEEDVQSSGSSSQDEVALEKMDSQIIKVGNLKEGDEAFAHLPEHEREIVKRQLDIPPITVTFKTLYRYATRNDIIIIAISALCAIIGGAVMPLMTVCIEVTKPGTAPANTICRLSSVN